MNESTIHIIRYSDIAKAPTADFAFSRLQISVISGDGKETPLRTNSLLSKVKESLHGRSILQMSFHAAQDKSDPVGSHDLIPADKV